jgi:hypothetical protein
MATFNILKVLAFEQELKHYTNAKYSTRGATVPLVDIVKPDIN